METMQNTTPKAFQNGASATQSVAHGGQYLTLRLGGEEYAIDILRVQEIRSYEEPTRMVNAPTFIKGVVNLRGVIVPIVDLRLKLGCDSAEYNTFTVVVVLNVKGRVVKTQPLAGGKFTYRLVRGELEFDAYGTVFAHCRIDHGPWHIVPFTLLPPV
mgnify:CR=1 FL=1